MILRLVLKDISVTNTRLYFRISIATCNGLQFSLTYFPAELFSSHKSVPPLKNFVLVRRISLKIKLIQVMHKILYSMYNFHSIYFEKYFSSIIQHYLSGIAPRILSIIARCSLLSCV